jgi:hypothetical protein
VKTRPTIGFTPITSKRFAVTRAPMTRSGVTPSDTLKLENCFAVRPSNAVTPAAAST